MSVSISRSIPSRYRRLPGIAYPGDGKGSLQQLRRILLSPVVFLAMANVGCASLGLVQSIVTARVLGAAQFGVIAVIYGVNATALNFLDIRLGDLAAKLYYNINPAIIDLKSYRASVLQICLIGNGLISLGLCTLGFLATLLTMQWFTTFSIPWYWLVAQTLALALSNWTSSFVYLQRFSGRFFLMGTWLFITQMLVLSLYLPIFLFNPHLDGYYTAIVVTAALSLLMATGLTGFIWVRYEGLPILRRGLFIAWPEYRRSFRFLFFGNLLGYSKLLHRGSDVLLVGFFCDDRVTGLYKFARSLTDGLYIFYDAMNQVYLPRFLELLSLNAFDKYRRLAGRVIGWVATATALLIVGEVLFLPSVIGLTIGRDFVGVEKVVLILTLPFFFVVGVHLWAWPIFIHWGRLGAFTSFNYLAGATQYAVAIGLFFLFSPSAEAAAMGYVAYYLVLSSGVMLLLWTRHPQVLPFRSHAVQ